MLQLQRQRSHFANTTTKLEGQKKGAKKTRDASFGIFQDFCPLFQKQIVKCLCADFLPAA